MIKTIVDSMFRLDGGAMNGIIPRPLWAKHHTPDDRGRIQMVVRCTVFKENSTGRVWLFEAGMGNNWDPKKTDIYDIKFIDGGITGGLQKLGIKTDDITDVVFTHLHFDHAAGAINHNAEKLTLTFPNAKLHVQKKHFEWAKFPSMKDGGSFFNNDILCMESSGKLNLINGNLELSEAVSVNVYNGHTEGMQTIHIKHDGKTYVVAGDLLPLFSHVKIPWIMAYDNFPIITAREKIEFLKKAAKGDWIIISVHDARFSAAKIRELGPNKYETIPIEI